MPPSRKTGLRVTTGSGKAVERGNSPSVWDLGQDALVIAGSGFGSSGGMRGLAGLGGGRCLGSEGDGGVGFKLPVVLKFHLVADFFGLEKHRYGGLHGQQIFP